MSTPLIVRKFQFTRDYARVKWKATLLFNLERSAATGLILAAVSALSMLEYGVRAEVFFFPLVWLFAYLVIFLPAAIIVNVLAQIFPIFNVFSFIVALIAVAPGDPLVAILKHFYPSLVPVEDPPLISLVPAFWVIDTPTEFAISDEDLR
ncbi:MAG: hypothetical protein AB2827_12685 [Candidatus Thiodiazotropha sp.]